MIETYIKHLVDRKKGDDDLADYAFNDKEKHSDAERRGRNRRVFDEGQKSDVGCVDETVRVVDERGRY